MKLYVAVPLVGIACVALGVGAVVVTGILGRDSGETVTGVAPYMPASTTPVVATSTLPVTVATASTGPAAVSPTCADRSRGVTAVSSEANLKNGVIVPNEKEAVVDAVIARYALFRTRDAACIRQYYLKGVSVDKDYAEIAAQSDEKLVAFAEFMAVFLTPGDTAALRAQLLDPFTTWEFKDGKMHIGVVTTFKNSSSTDYTDVILLNGRWY